MKLAEALQAAQEASELIGCRVEQIRMNSPEDPDSYIVIVRTDDMQVLEVDWKEVEDGR